MRGLRNWHGWLYQYLEVQCPAREFIAEGVSSDQLYALVWDGYLTTGDEKQDSVFAEVGEHGKAKN